MKMHYAPLALALACGPSLPPGVTLPAPLVNKALCALEAVRVLPADPDQVTLGQAKDLARALRACEAADAGAQ